MVDFNMEVEEQSNLENKCQIHIDKIIHLRRVYFFILMQMVSIGAIFYALPYFPIVHAYLHKVPQPLMTFGLSCLGIQIVGAFFRKYLSFFPFNLIFYLAFVVSLDLFLIVLKPQASVWHFLYFFVVSSMAALYICSLASVEELNFEVFLFYLFTAYIYAYQMSYYFFDVSYLDILYVVLGNTVFFVYLVYDTQTMIGGSKYEWRKEDSMYAASLVYFDVVMIFLRFVRLLSREIFTRR